MKSVKILTLTLLCIIGYNSGYSQQTINSTIRNILSDLTEDSVEILPTYAPDTNILFLIKPKSIQESQLYKLMGSLSNLSAAYNAMDTVKVKSNDNISSIVWEKNKVILQEKFNLTNYYQGVLQKVNNLAKDFTIYTGDSLFLPKLPVLPKSNASNRIIQYMDVYDHNLKSLDAAKFFSEGKMETAAQELNVSQEASLWAYPLKPQDLDKLKLDFGIADYNKLLGSMFEEYRTPVYLDVEFENKSTGVTSNIVYTPPHSGLKDIIQLIPPKEFRKYFVLDFFNGQPCTHGNKVMDVIKFKLAEYGIPGLDSNIVRVPINYFDNEDWGLKFLKDYYNVNLTFNPELKDWKENGESVIKALEKISKKKKKRDKCPNCIPEIFLMATMNHYYEQNPDVISTSFWVSTYSVKMVPPPSRLSSTNLITATLNESKKIEDIVREPISGRPRSSIEPLSTLYLQYEKNAGIIVGSKIGAGKYYGMYSGNGDRVSILGQGTGWGDGSTCINKQEDVGSSFATPDVGVSLWIAKAYWRSKSMTITPTEARRRLLLCIDIEAPFIGQFASGGTVNLLKLLTESSALKEDTTGKLHAVSIDAGSYLFYNNGRKIFFNTDLDGVSGLATLQNKVYAFFNSTNAWKEIKLDDMKIQISDNTGRFTISHSDDLINNYKQLLLFK